MAPVADNQSEALTDIQQHSRRCNTPLQKQRSILKTTDERALNLEEMELLENETKKQLILRRRRLLSHYRQYEQWRKRQFSYDTCFYRAHTTEVASATSGAAAASRRRRQYKRQYSCLEHCEGSTDSHENETIDAPTSQNVLEKNSFDSGDCGALTYQPMHCSTRHFHLLPEEHSNTIAERCTRSRINSAIFVSSEGKGFDSIEFLRRHGSQSVLCRKAKSAENISTDDGRKRSFSENRQWHNGEASDDSNREAIELDDCNPNFRNEIIRTSMAVHAAAITTSNMIVGSISIETPPSHIKDELHHQQSITSNVSDNRQMSKESNDNDAPVPNEVSNSRTLVHQKSSTSSTTRSQSPTISPYNSPKSLSLKKIKPKIIALPMVSVSGPSPPHEKDCL